VHPLRTWLARHGDLPRQPRQCAFVEYGTPCPFRIAGELVLRQDAAETQLGVRPRAQREPIDRRAAHRDAMECGDLLAGARARLEQPYAGARFSARHFRVVVNEHNTGPCTIVAPTSVA
jgi:hypothetical protein